MIRNKFEKFFVYSYMIYEKKIERKTKGRRGIFLSFFGSQKNRDIYIYIYLRWWTVYFGIDDDNGVETILLTE